MSPKQKARGNRLGSFVLPFPLLYQNTSPPCAPEGRGQGRTLRPRRKFAAKSVSFEPCRMVRCPKTCKHDACFLFGSPASIPNAPPALPERPYGLSFPLARPRGESDGLPLIFFLLEKAVFLLYNIDRKMCELQMETDICYF